MFNDGVGVVVFLTIFSIARNPNAAIEFSEIATLFGQEVIGGIALGLILGWITYKALKSIDDYEVEVIMSSNVINLIFIFFYLILYTYIFSFCKET